MTWYTVGHYLAGSSGILVMTSFSLFSFDGFSSDGMDEFISPTAIDTHNNSAHTKSVFMVS